MKRFITIPLLLILLFSQVGSFVIFQLKLIEIKREMKRNIFAQLPEDAFEVFENPMANNEVSWEEADKEFVYHGEMYDVARIKNNTKYYCLKDSNEKKLLENYAKQHSQNNHRKSQNTGFGFLLGYLLPGNFANLDLQKIELEKIYFVSNSSLTTTTAQITTPPPKG